MDLRDGEYSKPNGHGLDPAKGGLAKHTSSSKIGAHEDGFTPRLLRTNTGRNMESGCRLLHNGDSRGFNGARPVPLPEISDATCPIRRYPRIIWVAVRKAAAWKNSAAQEGINV